MLTSAFIRRLAGRLVLRAVLELFIGTRTGTRFQFWAKQGVSLIVAGDPDPRHHVDLVRQSRRGWRARWGSSAPASPSRCSG